MRTSQHDTKLMADAQLDAVPGGLIAVVIITANRPADPAEWTTRAIPRPYPVRHVPGVARTIGVPPEPK